MDDTARADEVEAFRIYQAGRKNVEVVGLTIRYNGARASVS